MSPKLKSRVWFMLSGFLAASMWIYVIQIWGAGQFSQFSDLYAPWWATHEIVLHHRDPYSVAVAHEIQAFIYGAPASAKSPGGSEEIAGGFAYPVHATFFLVPTICFKFSSVHFVLAWIFCGLTIASILLWLCTLTWRPSSLLLGTIVLCVLGSFPVAQAIELRNLSALAAFLIAAAMASLVSERLVLAGTLLAASTMKPQFVILLVPWVMLWTIAQWSRRRALALSFGASFFALAAVGELLVPGWIGKFFTILAAYRRYTFGRSLLDLWLPWPFNFLAAACLIAVAAAFCYRSRRAGAETQEFALVSCWILALTLIVIPTFAPHVQVLLLPGYLFIRRHWHAIWKLGRWPRLFLVLACGLPLWESLSAATMAIARTHVSHDVLQRHWLIVLYPSPILPLGLFLAFAYLLAMRPKTLVEDV
jgi:hypothetical protein